MFARRESNPTDEKPQGADFGQPIPFVDEQQELADARLHELGDRRLHRERVLRGALGRRLLVGDLREQRGELRGDRLLRCLLCLRHLRLPHLHGRAGEVDRRGRWARHLDAIGLHLPEVEELLRDDDAT